MDSLLIVNNLTKISKMAFFLKKFLALTCNFFDGMKVNVLIWSVLKEKR
jgi:hypothetical protein